MSTILDALSHTLDQAIRLLVEVKEERTAVREEASFLADNFVRAMRRLVRDFAGLRRQSKALIVRLEHAVDELDRLLRDMERNHA